MDDEFFRNLSYLLFFDDVITGSFRAGFAPHVDELNFRGTGLAAAAALFGDEFQENFVEAARLLFDGGLVESTRRHEDFRHWREHC